MLFLLFLLFLFFLGDFRRALTETLYDASGNRTVIEETQLGSDGKKLAGTDIQARYFDTSADGKLLKKTTGTQNRTHVGAAPSSPLGLPQKVFDEMSEEEQEAWLAGLPSPTVAHTIGFNDDSKQVYNETTKLMETKSTASHYLYAGSQYLGEMQESGEINVKSAHFSAVEVKQAQSSQRHQVQEGESLRSLSTLYYGNQDYWYIIADANGLPSDADALLTAGQSLEIPQQQNTANSFDSFTAYSIMEQIGDTLPSLPYVPAPPEAGCNAIATIIIVVVTVVATFYGQAWVGQALQGTAITGTAAGVVSGAAGAAIGSVAGQTAGIALGQQNGYDLGQIASSAVGGGIAGGISAAAGVGGAGSALTTAEKGVQVLNAGGRALVGAASALGAAATNKIIGGSSGFSWANIAASAVGAAVGSPIVGQNGSGNFITDVGNSILGAGASYATKKLVNNEGSWNNVDVLTDAFGNALGNSLVRAGQPSVGERVQEAANALGRAVEGAYDKAAINNTNAFGKAATKGLGALTDRGIDYVGSLNFTSPDEYSFASSAAGENLANNYVKDANFYANYAQYSAQYEQGLRNLSQSERNLQNAYRDRRFEIGNAQAAADFNAIGVSGFNVDLNDDAIRASVVGGIAAQTNRELTNVALGIASLPLLAVGGGALGGLAFRGAQVGIRGVQASGRAVTSFVDDAVRFGAGTALRSRAYGFNAAAIEGAGLFTEGAALTVPIGGGLGLAARNSDDISDFAARLTFGNGATFEGGLYRSVQPGRNPLEIHPIFNTEQAVHRYTGPGQGGLYLGSSQRIVNSEFTGNGASIEGLINNRYDANIDGLLDLTNPTVRTELGVSLEDLVRKSPNKQWNYEITNPLGRYAEDSGYNGIIAPAAQADGGVNIILFNPNLVR